MRTTLAAAAILLSTVSVATAQPALAPPGMTDVDDAPARAAEVPAAPAPAQMSEATATELAVGATAAGYALAIGMAAYGGPGDHTAASWASATLIMVGPSAGHLYAGEGGHAAGMIALRSAGVVTFAVGAMSYFVAANDTGCADYYGCTNPSRGSTQDDHTGGKAAMLLGAGAFIIGTGYDLFDAHRAARRHNERTRAVAIAPTTIQAPGGVAPGLALSGQW
jgi:hypothetical protein